MDSDTLYILRTKPIVEYLEYKGFSPDRQLVGGKLTYTCPFPDHEETKPSFMVWTGGDFQNFRCFGCLRCWNIIHLVSEMEDISYAAAKKKLGAGTEISNHDKVSLEIELWDKDYHNYEDKPLAETLESTSRVCRMHLEDMKNSRGNRGIIDKLIEDERVLVDELYANIDQCMLDYDFASIAETGQNIRTALGRRRDKFEELKMEALREYASQQDHQASR